MISEKELQHALDGTISLLARQEEECLGISFLLSSLSGELMGSVTKRYSFAIAGAADIIEDFAGTLQQAYGMLETVSDTIRNLQESPAEQDR